MAMLIDTTIIAINKLTTPADFGVNNGLYEEVVIISSRKIQLLKLASIKSEYYPCCK
ncbi:MAG: hypothetical protein ACI936_001712 [Paraglaciecola sp.]|jgi:hypothetical protein